MFLLKLIIVMLKTPKIKIYIEDTDLNKKYNNTKYTQRCENNIQKLSNCYTVLTLKLKLIIQLKTTAKIATKKTTMKKTKAKTSRICISAMKSMKITKQLFTQ